MAEKPEDQDEDDVGLIDAAQARAEVEAGIKAIRMLVRTSGDRWVSGWSIAVRGWRGLRLLAFTKAGTSDTSSQAYRDAMNHLLQMAKHADYQGIPKETRSAMTRLVDHIDEIDQWHATLSVWEKDRWTNPQTIVKHAPMHLLSGHGRNIPKRAKSKKTKGNPEAESLRAILVRVVTKYVLPVDPDEAKTLLERLYKFASDLDDSLDDVAGFDEGEHDD